jgi:hypothetical protein
VSHAFLGVLLSQPFEQLSISYHADFRAIEERPDASAIQAFEHLASDPGLFDALTVAAHATSLALRVVCDTLVGPVRLLKNQANDAIRQFM